VSDEINTEIGIRKNIILRVVLYGCQNWSLRLRKEYKQKVFENRVLRRIFGTKRVEIIRRLEKTA
jgi:hypothetical protein